MRFQVVPAGDEERLRSFGSFAGSIHAGPDYAERAEESLAGRFGRS
jgi:hypothetical protein